MADKKDYLVEETATDFRTIGQTVVKSRATGLRTSLRRTPVVGDVVAELYEVEASLGDLRFTVVHQQLGERFELRLLRDAKTAAVLKAATDASLASHTNLGVIVDARQCPHFGPFAVIAARRGIELADVLDDGMHSIDGALRFGISVGHALAELHENGVAHGMGDFRDIVCGSDGEWILCAAGLPAMAGAIAQLVAPEGSVSARADQWVLAAVVYQMLCGRGPAAGTTNGPGQRRPGVPKAVDDALVRALSAEPDDRFPTIDQFVDALRSSFFVWKQPSMVPVDAREISRLLKLHPDVSGGFERANTRQSVVVRVADLQSSKPTLQIVYQNLARLRREYRHNLAHGGIFVPTPSLPEPGTEAIVVIQLGDGERPRRVMLEGVVSHVTSGNDLEPPGAGVVFAAESLTRLSDFVRSVGVLHHLPAESVVTRSEDFVAVDRLSADGIFLLSYVMGPVQVGELRADCASLPFDFDEALAALIDAGALTHTSNLRVEPSESAGPTDVDFEFQPDGIFGVLELIDFHYDRRALLAAAAVTARNEPYFRDEGRLHFRGARVWADGLHDLREARRYARLAAAAEPHRREYQDMVRRVEALISRDSIRQLYAREFPATDVHFISWDEEERTVWVATTSKLQPDRARILGIDVRRDTIRHSETYPYALEVHPVWSSHTSLGEAPTLFRGASRPALVTRAGDWIFDRSPKSGQNGIFILDQSGKLTTVYEGECWGVAASADGKFISWEAFVDNLVGVFVAPTLGTGQPRQVHRSSSAVRCAWPRRGHALTIYECMTGEILRVTPNGVCEKIGELPRMVDDVVADSCGETVVAMYQRPGRTELHWLAVGSGEVREKVTTSVPVRQLIVRSDGCYIATTDFGTLLGSFTHGTDRHVAGLHLVPRCLHARTWDPGRKFVGMVFRQHGLELAELDPALLLHERPLSDARGHVAARAA